MTQRTTGPTDVSGPITTDAELLTLVEELIGGAIINRVWLLYLDARGRPVPLVVPVDGMCCHCPIDDGELSDLLVLAVRAGRTARAVEFVVVWEREGGARLTMGERETADRLKRLHGEYSRTLRQAQSLELRAQFLSHTEGVVRV